MTKNWSLKQLGVPNKNNYLPHEIKIKLNNVVIESNEVFINHYFEKWKMFVTLLKLIIRKNRLIYLA